MEPNGRNGIFGDRVRKEIIRWCSFSYFIWVIVFRAFSQFSFIAVWVQCGCTIFGSSHCRLSSSSCEIFFKIIFRVYLLNRKASYRVISSLYSSISFSFSLFTLCYIIKWQRFRLPIAMSNCYFNRRVPHGHSVV